MRILVHVTDPTFLRHFWGVLHSLAKRGHTVRIASPERRADMPLPAALLGRERIEFISCPEYRGDALGPRIGELRALRDYLRYLDGAFDGTPKLRARAFKKLLKALSGGEHAHLSARCPDCASEFAGEDVMRMLGRETGILARFESLLTLVEDAIPSDGRIEAFVRGERPDVMLVTPLVRIGSHQADYVKSAQALGVPVVFPVFSWDNLSTKGVIHVQPDRVLVWNEWQRTEAIEMHHVPAERVTVTGAPRFDPFFAMRPKMTRERFCRKLRFDPAQPIVAYLCSSNFVAGRERDFVVRWIDEVRRVPSLRSCNIVIRPHPREKDQWKKFKRPGAQVAVAFPKSISIDQTLYDTVHHSVAVVGLNTSAELEAGIVGRPVLTVLAPDYAEGQQGTVHFQYLLKEHGGFVEVAADFDAHRRHLEIAASGGYDGRDVRASIERLLRPHGFDRRATPLMVEAIEGAARIRHTGRAERAAARAWQHVRTRLAVLRRGAVHH